MSRTTAATAARQRQGLVIRRIPDEDGKLVTYMPSVELARLLGVVSQTINTWAAAGVVRSPGKLASHRHCSVLDATRLRRMSRKERLEAGMLVTPKDELDASKAAFDAAQERTLPKAKQLREHWDDYDLVYVITCVGHDVPFENIAKALGRSYSGICNIVGQLRQAGDLPPARPDQEQDWYTRALMLLTPEERAQLEGNEAA